MGKLIQPQEGTNSMSLETCAVFVGIDWADQEHAICLIDPKTQIPELTNIDQDPEAINLWITGLQQRFPGQKIAVCLEQKRGALIYALMKFDCLVLVPINPKQLARFREALGPSGAKNDPTDAWLLAELLAKHSERLRPWQPDEVNTRKIRLLAEDRRNLVNQRTALTNRLKSRLKQYFPVFLQVCGSYIYGELACQLLIRYPSLEKLQEASDEQLIAFYQEHHSFRSKVIDERLQQIRHAIPLVTDPAVLESSILIVEVMVKQILTLNQGIDQYDTQLATLMQDHPDASIFKALPGAGAAMAPRLLAAMGSDRERITNAQEVQQLSGIAPVTRQSGKSKSVTRRWAASKFLRQTFHEFAAHSIKHSPWAKAYYDMMRARGNKYQAAVRALAFKWIRIIFRCWKDSIHYDESVYTASLIKRQSPILKYLASSEN
jgi:transposase